MNPIAKFLVATERLHLQDLWGCHSKKGQVLVTSHGQHKTRSVVMKEKRRVDDVDWKEVILRLRNLRTALEKETVAGLQKIRMLFWKPRMVNSLRVTKINS